MSPPNVVHLPRLPALSGDDCRLLVESVIDYAIFMLDPQGRVATWNQGAQKIKGYEAGEIVGQHVSKFYPPEDVAAGKPAQELETVARVGRVEDEGWRVRKDGSRFWASVIITALRDESGQLRGFGKVTRDLTERLRLLREQTAREVAEKEEVQARYLAEASAALGTSLVTEDALSALASVLVPGLADWCSIYLLDGDGVRAAAHAHADPAKRDATREYTRRFPPDPAHAGGVWSVVRSGTSQVFHDLDEEALTRSTRDPEALAMLRSLGMKTALLVPIRGRSRVLGVVALVCAATDRRYDASDVRLAEEMGRRAGSAIENAQLYTAAQEAARAAEEASRVKDQFLATVSHELRTPLSAILGWAALLEKRIADPAMRKPIEVIHRNARAQVKIIDDILDVSRVITGKLRLDPKPCDLVAIARDAVEAVRPAADAKQIAIDVAPRTDVCLLVADAERLQQVVWNVLSNAVKFTDPGGRVSISMTSEGGQIVLTVTDTGQGIDPEFLPLVFERFKQADSSTTRRAGGLGLGLALVRYLVELHGGRVSAASEGRGRGTTITIVLPIQAARPAALATPSAQHARAASSPPTTTALDGIKVLVVDDEPDARHLVATVLREAGAEVETAGSATEGFEAFRRFRPHVVVSDIGMPDEDGFSLIRRIRALPPAAGGRIPSLALTAFAREEDRTRALSAGYTTHIGKPVDPDALAAAVANLSSIRLRD